MDELELIQKILAGDEDAKTRFVLSHQKRLYPIAVHFLGYQDPDAEDVVQETFLIAFTKLKDFKPNATLYTWLAHITVNLCYERLRKRKRQLVTQMEDIEFLSSGLATTAHERQGEDKDQQILIIKVRGFISQLAPNCRTIIEMRDLEGVAYAEIGKSLKIPIGTVMSRLARCRETLKQMFVNDAQGDKT